MSRSAECPHCHTHTPTGHLCHTCQQTLTTLLTTTPALLTELNTTLTRQNAGTHHPGKTSDPTPLPLHLGASHLITTIQTTLTHWATQTTPPTHTHNPHHATHHLLTHQHTIPPHHISELITDLTHHHHQAAPVIDHHRPDHTYYADCTCKTPLRGPKTPTITCPHCHTTWDTNELITVRDATINASLATAHEIAAARFTTPTGKTITLDMIKGHIRRHTLTPHGTNRAGTALYRILEVKNLIK